MSLQHDTPQPARSRFAGRGVLVTGSTGMGGSAARAVAAEGAHVFVIARDPEHLAALATDIVADGGRCATHAADLRDEASVEDAFAAALHALPRLDAVYSVAGISGRRFGDGPLHQATLEGWNAVMETNATTQFLVMRAAVRRMLDQPPDANGSRGAILTMSSTLVAHPAPTFFATHGYAASKGAIDGLTRAAAAHYAPQGIRINAIAPSLVATPMSRRAQDDEAILAYLVQKQPLAGGPIDVAAVTDVALHLLSDDARMITGQIVVVDGGWTVSEPRR
jgi:NAD(P)-dependent dehydrogenase (short-subunit alcohol dehydrogenase family)